MHTETVLITGASSGIGRELARVFGEHKSNLVLVARRREELTRLATSLTSQHPIDVNVFAQDLTEPDAAKKLVEQLEDRGINVDTLVNNAGFGAVGCFVDLPTATQLDMIQLNLMALTELTHRLLPGMIERRRGAVLNVASTAAFQPGPHMAVYFATKAYVLALSEALAEELRGTNVTVTCLCPGPTETGFGERSGVDRTRLFRLGTMPADVVAQAGYRAMRRGKPIVIPGFGNRMVTCSLRFLPRWVIRRAAAMLLSTTAGDSKH